MTMWYGGNGWGWCGTAASIPAMALLWVPETLRTSCGLLIFVEEAAEAVVSFDLGDLGWRAVGEGS